MTAEAQVSSQPVLLDQLEGGVLTLTLNRPERLNALNAALIEALSARVKRAAADPECRAFSSPARAGASAPGRTSPTAPLLPAAPGPTSAKRSKRASIPIIRGIRNLPKPVVCAVNGPAAGAGANIALACDIVLAAKSAQFLQAFARIGLIPDAGGTFVLPRLVGDARARALMMLAEPIGAERAEAIGMIYRAVDDEDLMGEAHTIAERLAAGLDACAGPHQARAGGFAHQHSGRPARPRARPAARGRNEATTMWKACALFWTKGRPTSSERRQRRDELLIARREVRGWTQV